MEEGRPLFDMKLGVGKDYVRGVGVIRLEVGTEGARTKTLNHQTSVNRLSQTGRCQMGQERSVLMERGWIGMRSVQFSKPPASCRLLPGEVLSGPSSVVR